MFRKLIILCLFAVYVHSKGPENLFDLSKPRLPGDIRDLLGIGEGKYQLPNRKHCPLCDSSVYSYCSEKLFHDSCCCSGPYDHLPHQCQYADCSFLHSNTCYEHRLITQCCCSNYIV